MLYSLPPPLSEREAAESLDTAESRIKALRSKFDKQTKRLHAKKEAVDVESRECEAEARAIAQARKEYAIARKEVRSPRCMATSSSSSFSLPSASAPSPCHARLHPSYAIPLFISSGPRC